VTAVKKGRNKSCSAPFLLCARQAGGPGEDFEKNVLIATRAASVSRRPAHALSQGQASYWPGFGGEGRLFLLSIYSASEGYRCCARYNRVPSALIA
jgi:hypothetical protein